MKHLPPTLFLPWITLLAACAGTPATPTPPPASGPRDCAQLEAQTAAAHAARREAEQRKGEAWKAVVPFAVAGRFAGANAAIRDSEQRLGALRAQARQLGCSHPV
jgi:hypothetical protein